MIVDASAVLAVLLKEPEEQAFSEILLAEDRNAEISPVNYLEVCLRVDRGDMPETSQQLDEILARMQISIAKVGAEQALLAREAYKRFGKGNHPARLNLGDCFAYALSKARKEPLLFKGDDFPLTDIEAAV